MEFPIDVKYVKNNDLQCIKKQCTPQQGIQYIYTDKTLLDLYYAIHMVVNWVIIMHKLRKLSPFSLGLEFLKELMGL